MAAHLAGYVVCGLYFGRKPTAIYLDPFPNDDSLVGVEHEASFAHLVASTGARIRGPEEEAILQQTALEDATLALAGRAAEVALRVSTTEEADALSTEDFANANDILERALEPEASPRALESACRTAESLRAGGRPRHPPRSRGGSQVQGLARDRKRGRGGVRRLPRQPAGGDGPLRGWPPDGHVGRPMPPVPSARPSCRIRDAPTSVPRFIPCRRLARGTGLSFLSGPAE